MVQAVTFILVRSVFGAVLGMFYFGFNTGVVNAPEAAIRDRVVFSHWALGGFHAREESIIGALMP